MYNISFINSEIFKELPHVLESWWKITVNVANQINSGLFNNFVCTRVWLDVTLGYVKTLLNGISTYSTWWTVPIILLFIVPLPLYLGLYRTEKRLKNVTSNIPGPSTFPIFGNVSTFGDCNFVQFFQKLVEVINKYGPVVRFWEEDKLYIVISDAESIETLLTNKALTKKSASVSKTVRGSGVKANGDDKWKIHRRIISSTFNSNVLDHFMGNFVENSSILTQKLKSQADGSIFDIYPFVCACALDVICETTMGTKVSTQTEGNDVAVKILLHAVDELEEAFKKPWEMKDWIRDGRKQREKDKEICVKYLNEFVDKVVAEKLDSRRNGFHQNRNRQQVEYVQWVRGKEMCLLDLLMQDAQLSVDDIREELCTLIVSGTKLTAITCCYVLSLLGVYQEIQNKVFEEQENIFGEDIHRAATGKDLSSMKYLEQVMKETMRLYPPVPFLFRAIEEDTQLGNGYILPKDSYALIFNYMAHRSSEYFSDPELFRPERFSCDSHPPYAYTPFGGGRRSCVAYKYGMMEAKTILSAILRTYQVTTPGGVKSLDRNLQAGMVLKPEGGFRVEIIQRPAKVMASGS